MKLSDLVSLRKGHEKNFLSVSTMPKDHQNSQGGYESSEEEKVLKKRVRKSSFQLYAPQSNINDKLKRLRKLSDTFYDNYVEDLQDNHTPSNNTVKSVCTIKE